MEQTIRQSWCLGEELARSLIAASRLCFWVFLLRVIQSILVGFKSSMGGEGVKGKAALDCIIHYRGIISKKKNNK